MTVMEAHRLQAEDVVHLHAWFADTATNRWLGDSNYPSLLLGLSSEQHGRWAFVVSEHGERVALVDVERDSDNPAAAAVAVAVAPSKRGMGIGRRALILIGSLPELATVHELVGEVEAGNVAAERCAVAAGFQRDGIGSERAFSRYVLRLGERARA
jgi:RimJ/RimL family protein N-acetyltransferase